MKKKVAIVIIITLLTLGSIHAYAATYLNSSLLGIIMDGFGAIKARYDSTLSQNSEDLDDRFANQTSQYVNDMSNKALAELESHKGKEVLRSEQELNAYFDALTKELDSIADSKVNEIKDSMTRSVNDSISKTKDKISKDLENQLKNILK